MMVNVWTLIILLEAIGGLVLSLFDSRDTWRERKQYKQSRRQSGILWINTHGNYRTSVWTLFMFVSFMVASGLALVMEPSELRQIVVRCGAIGAMTLLVGKRLLDRLDRRQIRHLQQQEWIEVLPGSELDQLGGPTVIEQVVAGWYGRMLRDELIRPYFDGVSVSRLIRTQAEFITRVVAKLPTHIDLRKAHAHLGITSEVFDRSSLMFRETMADFHVPAALCELLGGIVMSTRDQIVTKGPS